MVDSKLDPKIQRDVLFNDRGWHLLELTWSGLRSVESCLSEAYIGSCLGFLETSRQMPLHFIRKNPGNRIFMYSFST